MKHPKANNENRICIDRRKFSYAAYVPERRSGLDRRNIKATQSKRKVVYA